MSTTGNIRFDYNCDQKSSEFSRVDGKPFCQVCQTTVHNLIGKSKEEIEVLLLENNGQLCGTFYLDQLENEPEPRRLNFSLVVASLATFFTFSTTKYFANTNETIPTEQHDVPFVPRKFVHIPPIESNENIVLQEETSSRPIKWIKKSKDVRGVLVIGKRKFFRVNSFPWIHCEKMRPQKGRLKY